MRAPPAPASPEGRPGQLGEAGGEGSPGAGGDPAECLSGKGWGPLGQKLISVVLGG